MSITSEVRECESCGPRFACREHRDQWAKALRDEFDFDAKTTISLHARDRWGDRTPRKAINIERALAHSNSVDHVVSAFENSDGEPADDVRIYHGVTTEGTEYTMLFVLKTNTVVTTYEFDGHTDPRVEAYINRIVDKTVYYES